MAHGHHGHSEQKFNRSFAIAVFLNLIFTFTQAGYAIAANSMSLLADAAHNFADVLGLLFAWGANWLLTKPASERYSYGYKRTSILAAIINALLLVATSAIIGYESILKLMSPEPVKEIIVIVVAAIGIAINGGTAMMFFSGSHVDLNIKGAFLHLAADALISVGVVIAGIIIYFTGWNWLDPIIGLGIVVTILFGTWGLLRDSLNLLMDGVPHPICRQKVREYFAQLPNVTEVHDLHSWVGSTREIALTVHLIMPEAQLSDQDFASVQEILKTQFNIDHITIQVEQGSKEYPCGLATSCE